MTSIDKRLPKTTSYWKEGEIFFIKHTSFLITTAENQAISELIIQTMNDNSIKGLVINNREARGAWPKHVVDSALQEDSHQSDLFKKKKIATLTNSVSTTMQMNRVTKEINMEEWAKAFNSEFNEEVKAFLLG